jgi:hypothetical protein
MLGLMKVLAVSVTGLGAALLAGGIAYLLECWARHVLDRPFFYTSGSDMAIGPGVGLLTVGIACLTVHWEAAAVAGVRNGMKAVFILIAGTGGWLFAGKGGYMLEFWMYYPHLSFPREKPKPVTPDDVVNWIGFGAGLFAAGIAGLVAWKDKRS